MAGYECSDQLNCFGSRVDLLKTSGHMALVEQDYWDIAAYNIKTVREGIRWSMVEKVPYQYDWTDVIKLFEASKKTGTQQVWDICHFGFPDDLTPLHPMFARRLTAVCVAFVHLYKKYFPDEILVVTPINEVSFISWLGGDVKGTSPFCHGQGWDVKYNLMRAYIEAVHAIKNMDASVKILATEPLINIALPLNPTAAEVTATYNINQDQFQAMDMLSGKICKELGGSPECMDIAGFNFYYNNQRRVNESIPLNWLQRDGQQGWRHLSELVRNAWQRYYCPVIISETSHAGGDRPLWMRYVGEECKKMLDEGLPLLGVCLYPVIDRTDWDYTDVWHHSGLWDTNDESTIALDRILHEQYSGELRNVQKLIGR